MAGLGQGCRLVCGDFREAEKTKPTGGGGSGGLRYFVPAREEEIAGTTARPWEEEYDLADLLAGSVCPAPLIDNVV